MPTKHDGETFKSGAGNVPERDEETEDFIRKTILVQWGNFSTKYILDAMREVAAFSARRAREKALNDWAGTHKQMELLEFLMTQAARVMQATNAETLKIGSDMIGIGKRFDMKATLKELKSTT